MSSTESCALELLRSVATTRAWPAIQPLSSALLPSSKSNVITRDHSCRTVRQPKGLSPGGQAAVTLVSVFAFLVLVGAPIYYLKRKQRLAQEAREAEQRANLMHNA